MLEQKTLRVNLSEKSVWMPRLSDVNSFETWQKKGSKSVDKVAKKKSRESWLHTSLNLFPKMLKGKYPRF